MEQKKDKKSEGNIFRIVCPAIDKILLVRKISPEEAEELYKGLIERVKKQKTDIHLHSYAEFIVKCFLVDKGRLLFNELDKIEEGEDAETFKRSVIYAVYNSITALYQAFKIEVICSDINQQVAGVSDDDKHETIQGEEDSSNYKQFLETSSLKPIDKSVLLERTSKYLRRKIIGQDEPIDAVMKHLKLISANMAQRASFYMLGRSGVGKTELAKLVGKRYSGNFYKINCGEFTSGYEQNRLLGAPPGYVGFQETSILEEKAKISNKWVFLFDEFHRAHSKFEDFVLNWIEEGTVTDNLGNELDFSQSIFFMTSNLGLKDMKRKVVGFDDEPPTFDESKEMFIEEYEKKYSDEFRNRIDEVLLFNELNRENMSKIARLHLGEYPVKKTKVLVDHIVDHGFSTEYGARGLRRFIKKEVGVPISEMILKKQIPAGGDKFYKTKIEDDKVCIIETMEYQPEIVAAQE